MVNATENFQPGNIQTADYVPTYIYGPYFWEQRKPWFHRRFIPAMLRDERIKFGLRLLKGPILANSRFEIECEDQELEEYISNTVRKFWAESAVKALRAIEWGYSGSEVIYAMGNDGKVQFDSLKVLTSYDTRVFTVDGVKAAIRVKSPRDSRTGFVWLYGPKGFWHVHEREQHQWYGLSRLLGCYPAWFDKFKSGGAHDSLSLFFFKYALTGHVVKYPPRQRKMPNGQMLDPKEEAERIATYTRTGATLVLPNERDGEGNPLWEIEYAQNTASGAELIEYWRILNTRIFEGLGIPEELIQAGETGSGYAGRRVPAQSFYSLLQEIAEPLLMDFNEQIVRPLVDYNFGEDKDYILRLKPLSASELEEELTPEDQPGESEGGKALGPPQTNEYQ